MEKQKIKMWQVEFDSIDHITVVAENVQDAISKGIEIFATDDTMRDKKQLLNLITMIGLIATED